MSTATVSEKLKTLAKDLSKTPPRSPRETLAGYVIAPRMLDKCRAELAGTVGDYWFNRYMDRLFFDFTEIRAEDFQAFVATGASDEEVAEWITRHAKPRERIEIVRWNNHLRDMTLREAPDVLQLLFEKRLAMLPQHRPVYHIFDLFDLDEGRI